MTNQSPGDGSEDKKSENYEVGYKKPPKHSQFKPGKSGNAAGRKPKLRNLKTDFLAALHAYILVREGESVVRMTVQQALLKSLLARAIKGDRHATDKALFLATLDSPLDEEQGQSTTDLKDEDRLIFEAFLQRSKDKGADHEQST